MHVGHNFDCKCARGILNMVYHLEGSSEVGLCSPICVSLTRLELGLDQRSPFARHMKGVMARIGPVIVF